MATLDAMVLLAGDGPLAARTRESKTAVLHMDVNILALEAGHLRGDYVAIGSFVEIDGRRPAGRPRCKPVEPLLDGEQIANGIPAGKRHACDRSTGPSCGTIARFYAQQNMASIQATRMKKGMLVKIENDLFRVLELQHVTPGNLRGFVRVKFRNIRSGTLSDQKLRSEDTVERATLDEREMQYLYKDGDDFYFMDTSSYDQIHISSEALGDSVSYLKPEMTIQVEFYGSEPVGIELPQTVDLKVMETVPGIKGATASNQVKPATLETGLVVQVPPFINEGDLIRVSTDTGEYLARA
jgi:elongation factor P